MFWREIMFFKKCILSVFVIGMWLNLGFTPHYETPKADILVNLVKIQDGIETNGNGSDCLPMIFEITLSGGPSNKDVFIDLEINTSSSLNEQDYEGFQLLNLRLKKSTLTTGPIHIPLVNDLIIEDEEFLIISISELTSQDSRIKSGESQIILKVEDQDQAEIQFVSSSIDIDEGGGPFVFSLQFLPENYLYSDIFEGAFNEFAGFDDLDISCDGVAIAENSLEFKIQKNETNLNCSIFAPRDANYEVSEIFNLILNETKINEVHPRISTGTLKQLDIQISDRYAAALKVEKIQDGYEYEESLGVSQPVIFRLSLYNPQNLEDIITLEDDLEIGLEYRGSAISSDFVNPLPNTTTLYEGETSADLTINVIDDFFCEPLEYLILDIINTNNQDVLVTNDNRSATAEIFSNDLALVYLPLLQKPIQLIQIWKDEFINEQSLGAYEFTNEFGWDMANQSLILKRSASAYNTRAILKPSILTIDHTHYFIETNAKRGDEINTQYGLLFGYNLADEQFYRYMLNPDTCEVVIRYFSFENGYIDLFSDYVTCNKSGKNNLKVEVDQTNVSFFINGYKLSHQEDLNIHGITGHQAGLIMLAPGGDSNDWEDGFAEAYFDEFNIFGY